MLDQLMKIVEQNAGSVVDNKAIPDQFSNAAIKEITNQIFYGLKGQVSDGNMQGVISLFQTGITRQPSPVINAITDIVSRNLVSKFRLAPEVAQSVASQIVPTVMTQVIKKTNDPRDIDFDLQQMLRRMSGDNNLDISSMMPQKTKTTLGSVFNKFFKK